MISRHVELNFNDQPEVLHWCDNLDDALARKRMKQKKQSMITNFINQK
jgi:hypothetical protein